MFFHFQLPLRMCFSVGTIFRCLSVLTTKRAETVSNSIAQGTHFYFLTKEKLEEISIKKQH